MARYREDRAVHQDSLLVASMLQWVGQVVGRRRGHAQLMRLVRQKVAELVLEVEGYERELEEE